jgi:hypothetical protein
LEMQLRDLPLRVILNSDVLHGVIGSTIARGTLPDGFARLCRLCRDREIVIVVPRTAKLEFERKFAEDVAKEIREVQNAYSTLDRYSLSHDPRDPAEVMSRPSLQELIEATGATVEFIEPTKEDYDDAHDRACLHRPPHQGGKSDEMRDLTIWAQALRTSREQGGAVLIANDGIFHVEAVSEEAAAVGLTRVHSFDEAIEKIHEPSSLAESIAVSLVEAVWNEVVGHGFPVPDLSVPYTLSDVRFTMGEDGTPSNVYMRLSREARDGPSVQANILMFTEDLRIKQVSMSDIRVGSDIWEEGSLNLQTDIPAPSLRMANPPDEQADSASA